MATRSVFSDKYQEDVIYGFKRIDISTTKDEISTTICLKEENRKSTNTKINDSNETIRYEASKDLDSNRRITRKSLEESVKKSQIEKTKQKSGEYLQISHCLTKPSGRDLDQVIVGQGRFEHRQIFEKAYRVGNLIGRGGFGCVYAGVRLSDNKLVAIKQIARDKIRLWCSHDGASVPKEVCLMRHSHGLPNVIRLLDFYEKPDSFILILSRPSCYKDLFDYITEKGVLDEYTAQKFFRQILNAVISLKSRNVVHRDIKDENILVNLKTNNCFLIDFGSGCHFNAGPLKEFEGTHLYAPPEWLNHGEYSPEAATVWSLGVLLYVMTNGDLPFQTDGEIKRGEFSFRIQPPLGAKELIKECLNMDPKTRLDLSEISNHPWIKHHIVTPTKIVPRRERRPLTKVR